MVSFDGHSSLLCRLRPKLKQKAYENISLKFKTLRNSGTLIHAGGSEHSLTLGLEKGKFLLLLRKGKILYRQNVTVLLHHIHYLRMF